MIDLIILGDMCRECRKELGYTQVKVAQDTGYSVENISAFENGRNDNCKILIWYLEKGLNIKDVLGGRRCR